MFRFVTKYWPHSAFFSYYKYFIIIFKSNIRFFKYYKIIRNEVFVFLLLIIIQSLRDLTDKPTLLYLRFHPQGFRSFKLVMNFISIQEYLIKTHLRKNFSLSEVKK